MRLLLDTHIFLWVVMASPRLKGEARRVIESAEQIYVSAASIWEVAIKSRLGKIEADVHELLGAIEPSGFVELPITSAHAAGVAQLPMLHADPFDRMLLSQALQEPLRFLTADEALLPYSDLVIVV